MYKCVGCEYTSNKKSNIENHVYRINPCNVFKDNSPRYENLKKGPKIECNKCNKKFATSSSRCRHEKKCSAGKNEPTNTIINNNTINNYNNNITINIDLAQYDAPYITNQLKNDIKEYLNSLVGTTMNEMTTNCYPGVFSMIYFNKDVPQNHTILYKNKKDDILQVYSGNSFIPIHKDEIRISLERILEDRINKWTSELGDSANSFYDQHFRYREDGKNEKDKEFRLFLERANISKRMVNTIEK